MPTMGTWLRNYHQNQPAEDTDLAYELSGAALAIGDEAFASVNTSSQISQAGKNTIAKGYIIAKAAGADEDPLDVFTDTVTDVTVSDADLTFIWNKNVSVESDGYSLDVSITKFFAIDVPWWDGDITVVVDKDAEIEIHGQMPFFAERYIERKFGDVVDLDGSVATAQVDAVAEGDNTVINVQADLLALEGELAASAVVVTAGVA